MERRPKMKIRLGRRTLMLGTVATLLVAGMAVAVATAVGIVGWEYTNSDEFCAVMCHSVHPEETTSHRVGAHARVHCVECHMGRTSTLHLMALKPTHVKELWGMIAGYERPLASSTLRPSREACESCHWPSANHHDSIALRVHYDNDAASSETRTKIVLHTGVGELREGTSKGIHWHIDNDVSFVSLDPQRREIPWVQVKKPDGTKVTYIDAETKVTAQQVSALEPRRMACYDCHNAVGHPFPNPEVVVDDAIGAGKIDRSLPGAKARAVGLITAVADLSGKMDDRVKAIDRIIAEQSAKAGTRPEDKAKEQKFNAAMRDILVNATFEEKGVTWKSFPSHTGHRDSPGCFRCHDGKHFNDKGEAIRLQCTLCHALPQVTREIGKGSVASTVQAGLEPPDSHSEPNFMHDHRMKIDKTCEMCHGKLAFGSDGGNFCSNPACHGRTWPSLNLNAEVKKAEPPKAEPAKPEPAKAEPQKAAPPKPEAKKT
jgi:hypothetical protein